MFIMLKIVKILKILRYLEYLEYSKYLKHFFATDLHVVLTSADTPPMLLLITPAVIPESPAHDAKLLAHTTRPPGPEQPLSLPPDARPHPPPRRPRGAGTSRRRLLRAGSSPAVVFVLSIFKI